MAMSLFHADKSARFKKMISEPAVDPDGYRECGPPKAQPRNEEPATSISTAALNNFQLLLRSPA